ncbi:MAG: LPS assembly lipoprotein LptE [Legionellales bacterium]|nr:LPS assembly lipoprotein LptE [Legionellales bacterium]
MICRLDRRLKQTFCFCVVLLLSGCGFHFRGAVNLPTWLSNVAVIVPKQHSELETILKNQLQSYQITLNDSPAAAKFLLIIEDDSMQQHIAGVSSSTTPRQVQVTYALRFKCQYAKGKDIVPSTNIRVTRLVTINSNRMLGSMDEEGLLKSEMKREAVIQIINRLSQALT